MATVDEAIEKVQRALEKIGRLARELAEARKAAAEFDAILTANHLKWVENPEAYATAYRDSEAAAGAFSAEANRLKNLLDEAFVELAQAQAELAVSLWQLAAP